MPGKWLKVISLVDLPPDEVTPVQGGGHEIALYRVGDDVYATDNICTHGHARLCDGFLDGHEIECPFHQGRFDVRDGRAMCEPLTEDVRTFAVRLDNGDVSVEI